MQRIPEPLQNFSPAIEQCGYEWLARHRAEEMGKADPEWRRFLNGYFPHEALDSLDRFEEQHFRSTAPGVFSSVRERVSVHFPNLFVVLRARLTALFVQPELAGLRIQFEHLEQSYGTDLAMAHHFARHLSGAERINRLHGDSRIAFNSIRDPLRAILRDLVAFGDNQRV